jgi:hypothetical protein
MKPNLGIACGLVAAFAIGCVTNAANETIEPNTGELIAGPIVVTDAGCPIGGILCVNGGRWDPRLCRCLSPDAGCLDSILCIRGTHWDAAQCQCLPDACISQEDGPCGGFTKNPCRCAPGLVCVPNRLLDLPGTCEPDRCCPLGWDMYACKEENGSLGLNCHNPQLGCLSSSTCGGGCDVEVTHRCPVFCDPIPCGPGRVFDKSLCGCRPAT